MTEAEEWRAVSDALREVGVDPTDLGRFVNRSFPGTPGFEPEQFDDAVRCRNCWSGFRGSSHGPYDTRWPAICQAVNSSASARLP